MSTGEGNAPAWCDSILDDARWKIPEHELDVVERKVHECTPARWAKPSRDAIEDFAAVLSLLRPARADGGESDPADDDGDADHGAADAHVQRWRYEQSQRLISAVRELRRQLPGLKARVWALSIQASREREAGAADLMPPSALADLRALERAIQRVGSWLRAPLIESDRRGLDWHATAVTIAHAARGMWEGAGNKNVGMGNKVDSPVVALTGWALERLCMARSPAAVKQALYASRARQRTTKDGSIF